MIKRFLATFSGLLCIVLAIGPNVAPGVSQSGVRLRPRMSHQRLKFWPQRVELTRKWSRFMYGTDRFEPRLIVEHWTGSKTQEAAIGYWNRSPKSTWAQFIIDPAGNITQLAPLNVVAKQAFGVSPWAIGVEHVGENSGEILNNPKELAASYRLTCWLLARFHLSPKAVVGHAEAPANRFFHFTYRGWQWIEESGYVFHDDFIHPVMTRYRRHLAQTC